MLDLKKAAVNRIIFHMRKVQDNMLLLEYNREQLPFNIREFELLRRAVKHDTSKFEDNFIVGFSKLPDRKLRTEEQEIEAQKYMDIHRNTERHHRMPKTYIDICEMVCDWDAISKRHDEGANCLWFYENVVLAKVPDMAKYRNTVRFVENLLRLLRYEKHINED